MFSCIYGDLLDSTGLSFVAIWAGCFCTHWHWRSIFLWVHFPCLLHRLTIWSTFFTAIRIGIHKLEMLVAWVQGVVMNATFSAVSKLTGAIHRLKDYVTFAGLILHWFQMFELQGGSTGMHHWDWYLWFTQVIYYREKLFDNLPVVIF